MGKTFSFWRMCVKHAARGNSASANDWQWVVANPLWQGIGAVVCAPLGPFATHYWRGAPLISPGTPIGILLGGLFGFVVTGLIVFVVRIFKVPSDFYHEEKERADTLQQQLFEFKNSLKYRLDITAEVEDQLLTGGGKLDGNVHLKNTSDDPMQYGPAVFSTTFQNDAPKGLNGKKEEILSPRTEVYYSFEFDERAMATNRGSVIFTADVDYGPVGIRTRRVHKKIEVEYALGDGKFIAKQTPRIREFEDIPIPG